MTGRDFSKTNTINRLRGLTPTFSVFDTNPSNPLNMTDGDFTTETGEGVKTLSAPANVGFAEFDMGAEYPVLIITSINVHRDSGNGNLYVRIEVSPDDINWYGCGMDSIGAQVSDAYYPFKSIFAYTRYFRVRIRSLSTSVSSVYHVKFRQVMALQLKD